MAYDALATMVGEKIGSDWGKLQGCMCTSGCGYGTGDAVPGKVPIKPR